MFFLFVFYSVFSQNGEEESQLPAKIEAYRILEDGSTSEELDGQAPAEIRFEGTGNKFVDYYTWYIYKSSDMENYEARYTDQDITYIFTESGDYLVRLETSNTQSGEIIGIDEKRFSIDDYELKVPNILVLDGTHTFRVTYKSVITFKCTIFNRWGNKIYEFNDPSGGWDGRYKGRYVSPGVYFYVISVRGGDGREHVEKGDINVLRPR